MANQVSAETQHSSVQINQSESVNKSDQLQQRRDYELQLLIDAKNGSEEAKADLLEMHTDFIFSRARKHAGKPIFHGEKMDLYQEGVIAFMRAVELYDPSRGVLFTTYAYDWVTQAIDRYVIKNAGPIKLPVQRYRQLAIALSMKNSGYKDEEIAAEFGLSEKALVQILQAKAPISSLEGDVSSEHEVKLSDIISDEVENTEATALVGELVDLLYHWVDHLDEEMQQVINMRYGLKGQPNRTYEEIANILTDYSQASGGTYKWNKEGVRQLEKKAVKKMFYMSNQKNTVEEPAAKKNHLASVGMFAQPVVATTPTLENTSNGPEVSPAA